MSNQTFTRTRAEVDFDNISEASTMFTDCDISRNLTGGLDYGTTFQSQSRRLKRRLDYLNELFIEVSSVIKTLSKEEMEENIKQNLARQTTYPVSQNL